MYQIPQRQKHRGIVEGQAGLILVRVLSSKRLTSSIQLGEELESEISSLPQSVPQACFIDRLQAGLVFDFEPFELDDSQQRLL